MPSGGGIAGGKFAGMALKAWATGYINAGAITLKNSFNVTSLTRSAVGVYTLTLTGAVNSTQDCAIDFATNQEPNNAKPSFQNYMNSTTQAVVQMFASGSAWEPGTGVVYFAVYE